MMRSVLPLLVLLIPACSGGALPGVGDTGSDVPLVGRPGGACFPNSTCFPGVVCRGGLCVLAGTEAGVLDTAPDRPLAHDGREGREQRAGGDRGVDAGAPIPDQTISLPDKRQPDKPSLDKPRLDKPPLKDQAISDLSPNPCSGVSCSSPPAPTCVGSNLRSYASGVCSAGACSYPYTDTPCPGGCSNASCQPPTCQGQSCNTPPADTCLNTTALATHAPQGTCKNGSCDYQQVSIYCSLGCLNGSCLGGSWQTINPPINLIGSESEIQNLALDASDQPHVFGCKSALHHAHTTPMGWVVDVVDNVYGCSFDALVTSAGQVVIAYYDPVNKDLRLARSQSNGPFNISVVDSVGDVGRNPALALMGSNLVIAYTDATKQALKLAEETAGGWTFSNPTGIQIGIGKYGNQTSLLVDSQQNLHLLTGDATPWEAYWTGSKSYGCVPVVYARRAPSGTWGSQIQLASGGIVPKSRALSLDATGQLQAVWIAIGPSSGYINSRPLVSSALVGGAWTPYKLVDQTFTLDERPAGTFFAAGKVSLAYIGDVLAYPHWGTQYMQKDPVGSQWSLFYSGPPYFKDVAVGKDGRARLLVNTSVGLQIVVPP